MPKKFNIAIIGATGMVGGTTLSILEERKFPINELFLVASHRSAGEIRDFRNKAHLVCDIENFDFSQTQIAFFSAGSEVALEYVPKAVEAGNVVIDKSSYFRYDPDVPLVVPEVNEAALTQYQTRNIIANPNCNTIPIVMALKPIYDEVGIKRLVISTYQAVSGSGKNGVKELADQTGQLLNGRPIESKVYPKQIAFNVLPHCDVFQDNGYTKEEMKIIWEIQKILDDKDIAISPTTVRVPVFYGHSASVNIETDSHLSVKDALSLLKKAPGLKVTTGKYPYPTPLDAAGDDSVFVGRIREDFSIKNGLNLWVVADNLRKGAALNAVQVAERLIDNYLE